MSDVRPLCHVHAEAEAMWHCPACGKLLCGECVRVFATRDLKMAACKKCGGKCDALLEEARNEGTRAGGIETPEDVRRRIRRDWYIPIALLAAASLLHMLYCLCEFGVTGLLLTPAWLLGGTVITTGAWTLMHRFISLEFEPPLATIIKLAAIYLCVHFTRLWLLDVADLQMPTGTLDAIASLGLLAFILVLIPATMVAVAAASLFDLDAVEITAAVVTLFFGVTLTWVMLKLGGVPG